MGQGEKYAFQRSGTRLIGFYFNPVRSSLLQTPVFPVIARIMLFGMYRTGMRDTPYYGLWTVGGAADARSPFFYFLVAFDPVPMHPAFCYE